MREIRLALVDDHKMFRDGIKSVLSDEKCIKVDVEAGNAEEMVEILKRKAVDIVITDIGLPGMSGIELCSHITQNYPATKVLILSMHNNEEFVMNSLKSGASGYLPKETGHEELIFALRKISEGEIYFNHNISQTIIKGYQRTDNAVSDDPNLVLSHRELEVLRLYAEGSTNSEIAEQLFISVRTVESHKTHILQKLGLKSNVDMVKVAIKYQIVKL
jgi:DNA-binding NarL/FixJ family response regulator